MNGELAYRKVINCANITHTRNTEKYLDLFWHKWGERNGRGKL
jgi:hypothetical protein